MNLRQFTKFGKMKIYNDRILKTIKFYVDIKKKEFKNTRDVIKG